ncbi:MAG: hypothetical protein JWQ36_688 [Enterovirga sp.]|jgi:L-amino acid N-acyltransferase YncA|nr:hypothetical protein [Enterovirga sp.]
MLRACETGDLPEITAIYRGAVLMGAASFQIERTAALTGGGRRVGTGSEPVRPA